MPEIPSDALARACDYDHQHRPRDNSGWTRMPNHQILRLLDGLAEQGYILVAQDDLAETIEDAHAFNDTMLGGDDAATARLDRLRAALSGTLHTPPPGTHPRDYRGLFPRGPVSVSAPPVTPGHAGAPPNPPSTRTSPHMSDTDHTRNPRNGEA